MSRTAFWVIMGPLAAIAAMCYVGSVREWEAPPRWFVISGSIALALYLTSSIGRAVKARRTKQSALKAFASVSDDNALAMRLMGDYPPFVIEAAEDLGARKSPAAVPLLMHATELLMRDKPGGWREMASAMVGAMRSIGDPKPLPLLRRLQNVRGVEEIQNLAATIAEMESAIGLLRPTLAVSEMNYALLHAAESPAGHEGIESLLRPSGVTSASEPRRQSVQESTSSTNRIG